MSRFWIDELHLKAQRALTEYSLRFGVTLDGPAIPVEDIADLLYKLRILPTDELGEDTSGLYYVESRLVQVNATEPQHRQRFTVGHEVGHHVLHVGCGRKKRYFRDRRSKVREGVLDETLGPTAESGSPGIETEANVFASELLMPSQLVTELFRSGVQNVEALAKAFQVSTAAMEYKLTNLRLIVGRSPYGVFDFYSRGTGRV